MAQTDSDHAAADTGALRYKENTEPETASPSGETLKRHKYRKFNHKKFWALCILCVLIGAGMVAAQNLIIYDYDSKVYGGINDLPPQEYALLLGCNKYFLGIQNKYYTNRIRTAARLYHAGKIKKIVASGTNHKKEYNEPDDMKQDLIAAGVPEDAILCDYAGRRTLDSVVRMDNVFHQKKFLIITQREHCRRALFLAAHHGLDAIGFEADKVIQTKTSQIRNESREVLACAAACADVYLLHRRPRFEH